MKSSRSKGLLVLILVLVAGASAIVYYMWNKPKRSASSEKGIEITASQLVKEYKANEAEANQKYLDKAIQVTGIVLDISNNQDGKATVMLSSDDPMTGVFCTLKESEANTSGGSSVTIKGFCSGMLSDVRLREAVIVK